MAGPGSTPGPVIVTMAPMHEQLENLPLTTPVVIVYKSANRPADATARVVHELADRLRADGRPTVVHGMDNRTHPHRPRPTSGGVPAQIRYGFGKVRDQLAEGGFLVRTARALARQPDTPQLIISVDYPTGVGLAPVAARLLGRRSLHTLSWVMDDYQDQKLARKRWAPEARVRRFIDRLAIRKADTVVTIGQCMADRIAAQTGRRAEVIPVWAHSPSGTPAQESIDRVRASWGADPDTLVVLYSGHAAQHHPLEALADAAESLADHAEIEFVVSGVGLELERLKRSPRRAGMPNWRFGERVPKEDVDALLAAGDVHVVSLAENVTGTCVPSKTYAALVRRKPVLYLGSPEGQAGRDVLESGAGYVVPSDDPAAIREAVLGLAARAERERMGRDGQAWAEQHRELESVIGDWLAIVDRILPRTSESRGG